MSLAPPHTTRSTAYHGHLRGVSPLSVLEQLAALGDEAHELARRLESVEDERRIAQQTRRLFLNRCKDARFGGTCVLVLVALAKLLTPLSFTCCLALHRGQRLADKCPLCHAIMRGPRRAGTRPRLLSGRIMIFNLLTQKMLDQRLLVCSRE